MQKERVKVDEIIRCLNYTLDCSTQRLKWFIETGNDRYLTDCDMYLRVASIYIKDLTKDKKYETCEG